MADIVTRGFEVTGRQAGTVAGKITDFTGGHPQRVMQLADAVWRRTPLGGTPDAEAWVDALSDIRCATAAGLERLYSGFEGGEKAVLRIIAAGGSIFGSAADVLGLPVGTAQHARGQLLESGELAETANGGQPRRPGLRGLDPAPLPHLS